jgi:TonB family protein
MRISTGILQFGLYVGVSLAGSPLGQAQDAVPATLRDTSKRTEATPTPTPNPHKPKSKGFLEISAATPNETPPPLVEQTPPPEELATPAATTAEKEPPLRKRAVMQRKLPELPPVTPMSLSAAKAMAMSAPLPEYEYKARRAHTIGNGVCVMLVDTTSGRVTNALMAQSTGSAVLDKITTDTFRQWRFKPGTVSQVQVPISYQ